MGKEYGNCIKCGKDIKDFDDIGAIHNSFYAKPGNVSCRECQEKEWRKEHEARV